MTIPSVTPLAAIVRTDTDFVAKVDALFSTLLSQFITEENATVAGINAAVIDITAKQVLATYAALLSQQALDAGLASAPGILAQTITARDQALAGLGAADNSQLLGTLAGQDAYAIDIAGQIAQELVGMPAAIEALANFVAEVMDLVGATARQAGAGAQIVPAPANASARGSAGEWAWDSGFIYVCTALNTWKRVAIATW